MKAYTDLEQSKKLAEILPLESADMNWHELPSIRLFVRVFPYKLDNGATEGLYPCWSLAALLQCLSKIKPQVYTPILFPTEGKWILQFLEYGHGNVWEVSCDNPVDACVAMIEKLHEFKLL
jgi:hypothetical protein